jgi:integrase
MAVMKRNGFHYIYFRPFKDKKVGVKLPEGTGKVEGKRIEAAILTACRIGNYANLDPVALEVCMRMFLNQSWQLPEGLAPEIKPQAELTLWKAAEMFMKYPDIRSTPGRWRHEIALSNIVAFFGKDCPVKGLWVPELKRYRAERLSQGVKPSTVNREMSALSRLFGVLIELQLVEVNPCRLVKRLSERALQRQVYISFQDFQRILAACPDWYKPIVQVAYYTGLRRGEILGMKRERVKLSRRLILLAPEDTKEADWKRVPIRLELIPILEECLKVTCLKSDQVFLINDEKGVRPASLEGCKNPWRRRIAQLGFENKPHFHDLRHTWRANARRSGMDPVIAESILGHWHRERSVNERYGRLSDEELVRAVDSMTFDHGPTEIVVSQGS